MKGMFIILLGLGAAVFASPLGCNDEGLPASGADAGPVEDAASSADSHEADRTMTTHDADDTDGMAMHGSEGGDGMTMPGAPRDATADVAPVAPDSQLDAAEVDTVAACVPACASTQVCCTDSHGHNPTCVEGASCP